VGSRWSGVSGLHNESVVKCVTKSILLGICVFQPQILYLYLAFVGEDSQTPSLLPGLCPWAPLRDIRPQTPPYLQTLAIPLSFSVRGETRVQQGSTESGGPVLDAVVELPSIKQYVVSATCGMPRLTGLSEIVLHARRGRH